MAAALCEPLVSIITITFNHQRFIQTCIDSVLSQKFCDWEMVIVDDESSDETRCLVNAYRDPRIKLLRQSHRGPEGLQFTYNFALSNSAGKYVCLLEGDDFWPLHGETIARQLDAMKSNNCCLVHGIASRNDSAGRLKNFVNEPAREVRLNRPLGSVVRALLLAQNFSHTSTFMIRKSVLDSIGGFQGAQGLPTVDIPTLLRLGLCSEFKFVKCHLGCHRKHEESVVHMLSSNASGAYFEKLKEYSMQFFRDHPGVPQVNDLSEDDIREAWDTVIARNSLCNARTLILLKRWDTAQPLLRKRPFRLGLGYETLAVLGLFSCYIQVNVLEPILIIKDFVNRVLGKVYAWWNAKRSESFTL